ncbi:ABC transporter [Phytophthora palmivora]|uniref:ABC transporter n=1 Tax=Phytophthora palmivora TaxID=4796 RepID=A0A2P4YN60_9STRA|nr:ABC transporter [Phytophthora palmivora]
MSAGIVSRIFLSWARPRMDQAHKRQLNSSDVWSLPCPFQADTIVQTFQKPLVLFKRSLPRALFQVFGLRFFMTGLTILVSMLCSLVGPLALLSDLSDDQNQSQVVIVSTWVGLVFAAQMVQALADCYTGLQNEYEKLLKLSPSSRKKKSTGVLTTMYTSDCESLVRSTAVVHQMWLIPLQIVVICYMLVRVLDIAAVAGIAVIVLMLWLNHLVSKRMHRVRRECIRNKD